MYLQCIFYKGANNFGFYYGFCANIMSSRKTQIVTYIYSFCILIHFDKGLELLQSIIVHTQKFCGAALFKIKKRTLVLRFLAVKPS